MKRNNKNIEAGFTIIELMIALTALSLILVMSTVIMMRLGDIYTKGVTMANLQNNTRNLSGDIASALQFSANDLKCKPEGCGAGTTKVQCIGATRYTYILNEPLGFDSSNEEEHKHVLWRDTMSNSTECNPLDLNDDIPSDDVSNNDGAELLQEHVRLSRFSIDEVPDESGTFRIEIWTAYGDDDLVLESPELACRSDRGSDFCALSKISTTVIKRLE
jgi:prepilin-type N-terminal cleavage/methylation domain-containing protein